MLLLFDRATSGCSVNDRVVYFRERRNSITNKKREGKKTNVFPVTFLRLENFDIVTTKERTSDEIVYVPPAL